MKAIKIPVAGAQHAGAEHADWDQTTVCVTPDGLGIKVCGCSMLLSIRKILLGQGPVVDRDSHAT